VENNFLFYSDQAAKSHVVETPSTLSQMLADLKTKWRLAYYSIICLFDGEFPYTKKLLATLSDHCIQTLSDKWAKVTFVDKLCENLTDYWFPFIISVKLP
jgi:hypothetical protein